ncbi:MAG TPA: cytochrome c biogenesis protein DipZ [Steroidobacteraceae bacterium]|nr:cytochrome c biogenesis protein DipZ [Steroidobacteraceae bacterium]
MTLVVLVFFGGMLTILSPCILPVLPFVFARAEQPFLKSGVPLLTGMALTFAGVATLAAVGGSWAVHINQYGRIAALILLAGFALTLLSRRLADWMARPFIALGNRLTSQSAAAGAEGEVTRSLLLGVATGLLWAPCAGPILGLVLTSAALTGPSAETTLLLFSYAAGAAASLAIALLAGGRVFAALKRGLGAGEWIRRGVGAAVLLAVIAIALGLDSGVLTRLSLARTDRLENTLIGSISPGMGAAHRDALQAAPADAMQGHAEPTSGSTTLELPVEGQLPALDGATLWLNSQPLTREALRGKVVLIDFWTYSCINCLRALPYVKGWYDKYKGQGLVVIGVHAPEFAFEKDPDNVRRAVRDLGVTYPVALDNDYAIWRSFNNQYWPAHYFIDTQGRIRAHHFGEGEYDRSEAILRTLLSEAGSQQLPTAGIESVSAAGVEAAADLANVQSPETYVGYARAENFSSPSGFMPDQTNLYQAPAHLDLNQWALKGTWTVEDEKATLGRAPGSIVYRFHARDLHLVLGPGIAGKPVRFRVRLDGADPGPGHGADTDAGGNGTVTEQRLYQLIRQPGEVRPHTFEIEFLDPGVQAYAFTFG